MTPLGLLAWLGSTELSRQEERAERALREQAEQLLGAAARRLRERVQSTTDLLAHRGLDLAQQSLVRCAAALADDSVHDLFVLNAQGQLLFPRRSPPAPGGLPFHGPSRDRAMRPVLRAEWLAAASDLDGAIALLEHLTQREPRPGPRQQESLLVHLRASMLLGALLRRKGARLDALHAFRAAEDSAEDLLALPRAGRGPVAEVPAARLLAVAAQAELIHELEGDPGGVVDTILNISEGAYDDAPDELLAAVTARLRERLPQGSPERAAAEEARGTEAVRRQGRRFAREYEVFLAETVRRKLAQLDAERTMHLVYTTKEASWLLILREATLDELEEALLHGARWIGVRLDLAPLVNRWLDPFLGHPDEGLLLDVRDPDGRPVLPDPTGSLGAQPYVASLSAIGGLQLRAVPADPAAFQAARRASSRTRALLVVALSVVAAGAAFFLLRAVSREAELARLKVELVSRVSHELRTPLALIKMYGETLALGRARDPSQARRFAGIVSREADRLTVMIDRILDFSKREAGTLDYVKEPVELSAFVRSVTDRYRPHLESVDATLTCRLENEDEDAMVVEADRGALEGVVVNLLENAAKYTPRDAPDRTIEVALRRDGGHAVLEVMDRGVGIPSHERTRVFQSFYRASNAGETRGAGLGLDMVRHFVQAHGGRVEALDRPGGGTILRMSLPLREDPSTKHEQPNRQATRHRGRTRSS